jgi:hypothetical protein
MISAERDGGGNEITVHGNNQPHADVKSSRSPAKTQTPADGFGITATVTSSPPIQRTAPTTAAQASTAADHRTFLENVLVWPGSAQAPGWMNLHVNAKNEPKPGEPIKNGGKPWVTGWPFKTIDDVLNRVSWVESTDAFFNVWVCMSQQSECAQKPNGKLKAVRKAANATWLKAIWIDCDVKPGDAQHYHTMTEAFDALDAFRNKVGLPPPSMVVNSGGGLHVYWVSDTPMSPDEWLSYADGLKALLLREGVLCDTGLTTDAARILRVPGTLNHKYNPPRPVQLLHHGQSYDFASDLASLKRASASLVRSALQPPPPVAPTVPGVVFDTPDPAFAALTPDDALQAGTGARGPFLVDPAPIFADDGCSFLRDAKANGGADLGQPLWNLSVLCTTFMENGNALAHEISKGHATYTADDTQAFYDRKMAERERGVGYPSCRAIKGTGGQACGTCPHFAKGKSPLNIPANTATVNSSAAIDVAALSDQPVTPSEPWLSNLDAALLTRIFEGDTEGRYAGDSARLAFVVAFELAQAGLDKQFIARVLMTAKCGEYVQEKPARRLDRTIARALDFAIDPDLEQMNSQHAVLPIGDKTRIVTWGPDVDFPDRRIILRAQTFPDFKNLHSNKRKTISTNEIDADGNSIKKKVPIGEWWLRHERRRQYDGGQKFMPKHDAEVVNDTLNMYQGFAVHPRKPEGRSGASGCQLFLDHGFKVICSDNEEHWDYLLKREAWIAQHRRRSEIAAAYRTEAEGSGKGFWCNHLGCLYGQHYMQVNNPNHVVGKHNPHLETLIKLCADEALFVGDPHHRNALFSMITEPMLTIEPKFVGVYQAVNHLNIDITTNARHFVPASRTARRFFIPTVSENRVGDRKYFKRIEDQLKSGGYEALLYHLLNEVDLSDFDVRSVPKTAGLAEQVEYSRKGLDGLIEKICSEGRVPCAHGYWPGFSVSNGYELKQGFDYFIDNHHDRELRDLRALKVKVQLRRHWGCVSGDDAKRRDGSDMVYGIKWPSLADLRTLFIERHGPQDWLHPEVTEWPGSASADVQNPPSPMHPTDRIVAPSPSEAALIAKDLGATERFANRRVG